MLLPFSIVGGFVCVLAIFRFVNFLELSAREEICIEIHSDIDSIAGTIIR